MVIDKIVAVPRTGLYRLVFDGGEKIDIDVSALAEFRLTKGLELSDNTLAILRERSAYLYWTNKCLNKLARRPQSRMELTRFMQMNKVDTAIQEKIIGYLEDQKYLNDEAFADWYVKSAHRKNKSMMAIKYELQRKGISKENISRIRQMDVDSDLAALKEIIAKKQTQSRYKDEIKLKQYLLRKGFSYDLIRAALMQQTD